MAVKLSRWEVNALLKAVGCEVKDDEPITEDELKAVDEAPKEDFSYMIKTIQEVLKTPEQFVSCLSVDRLKSKDIFYLIVDNYNPTQRIYINSDILIHYPKTNLSDEELELINLNITKALVQNDLKLYSFESLVKNQWNDRILSVLSMEMQRGEDLIEFSIAIKKV